jgi:hypothetical protein
MNFNYDQLLKVILGAVDSRAAIPARMGAVIDECERQYPHPDWRQLREVDFLADQAYLEQWLSEALPGVSGHGVRGLWFGIATYQCEDETETIDLYARSTRSFDSDQESLRWIRDSAQDDSMLDSTVLDEIHDVAYAHDGGLANDAEYPLALAYGAIVAIEAVRQLQRLNRLQELEGAVASFDEGDGITLGRLHDGRFVFNAQIH